MLVVLTPTVATYLYGADRSGVMEQDSSQWSARLWHSEVPWQAYLRALGHEWQLAHDGSWR